MLDLTRRVTELEQKEDQPVTAPFEVVDSAGNPIFRVDRFDGGQGISVMGSGEQRVSLTTNGLRIQKGNKELIGSAVSLEIKESENKFALMTPAALGVVDSEIGTQLSPKRLRIQDGNKELIGSAASLEIKESENKFALVTPAALGVVDSEIGTQLTPKRLRIQNGDKELIGTTVSLEIKESDSKFSLLDSAALLMSDSDETYATLRPRHLRIRNGQINTTVDADGLILATGDDRNAELYRRKGKAALRILKGGEMMAGMGITSYGGGGVHVGYGSKILAAVQATDEGGFVDVFGAGGKSIAGIGDDGGRGIVTVRKGGEAVAVMRLSTDGSGGNITLSKAGFGGVFMAGAASDGGGEACLNRVTGGGQQRRVCLGIELPSMGLGK